MENESEISTDQTQSDNGETTMEVILLERIGKLGQMGDVVRSRTALPATSCCRAARRCVPPPKTSRASKAMKAELQARNLEIKTGAEKVATKLNGKTVTVLRQASESGQLYGSVSTRDIASLLNSDEAAVSRARMSCSMHRSRPSASTRCRWRCIRK